jgi:demethylmenaquinone methyltransferase / 2-methoxy-6-polyprenyl-1,4-benzoquinol methylase
MRRDPGTSPLARAFHSPETKRAYVGWLFGEIAPRYDLITRVLSFGRDQYWKRAVVDLSEVRSGDRALDLACGTGDLAWLAADRGASVTALDLAPAMIRLARLKPRAGQVAWIAGDMGDLPFESARFDVVTTGYGLRNVPELQRALREIHRVLAPGGRLCALDFDRPDWPLVRAVYLGYLTVVGASLGWVLHRDPDTYRYIPESIRHYPGARQVAALMTELGFRDVRVVRVLGGLMAIHLARR